MKTEILFGFHPVYEALKAGRRIFFTLYMTSEATSKRLRKTMALAESKNIPLKITPLSRLNILTGTDANQGLGAEVSRYPFIGLTEIISKFRSAPANPFLFLLDHLVDPHNLGALLRTGACAGVDALITTRNRSASPTPIVSKISAGALEHVHLVRVTNMVNTIRLLKENGLWIIGLDPDAKRSIFTTDFKHPVGVVIGGEEKGIRSLVKKNCDDLVFIPQSGRVGSLNASVAGGIAMYEVFRQRGLAIKD